MIFQSSIHFSSMKIITFLLLLVLFKSGNSSNSSFEIKSKTQIIDLVIGDTKNFTRLNNEANKHHRQRQRSKQKEEKEDENRMQKLMKHAANSMFKTVYRGSDGEGLDAFEEFFWGMTHGVVMEIGGVDGSFLSQSNVVVCAQIPSEDFLQIQLIFIFLTHFCSLSISVK